VTSTFEPSGEEGHVVETAADRLPGGAVGGVGDRTRRVDPPGARHLGGAFVDDLIEPGVGQLDLADRSRRAEIAVPGDPGQARIGIGSEARGLA
jgi:hypothetical protein